MSWLGPAFADVDHTTRKVATRFVAGAIAVLGVGFLAAAFALVKLGPATWGLALLAALFGFAIVIAAFFFLLVPFRVDEMKEMAAAFEKEHGAYDPDANEG